jgi:hypothetical protein
MGGRTAEVALLFRWPQPWAGGRAATLGSASRLAFLTFLAGFGGSPAAAAGEPPRTAEQALAVEQNALDEFLRPSCPTGGGEIVVCGRRHTDRERLPLRSDRVGSLPGESASAVAVMRSIDTPRPQSVGTVRAPDDGAMFDFIKVAAMLLVVGKQAIDRDRVPPPDPSQPPPD